MKGAVLVTGASSGIGYATAHHLRDCGYTVYAGVRNDADARRLRVEGIEPLLLDVCDSGQIAQAAETIRASGTALSGLVNNAGIVVAGPLEYLPIDDLRRQFEVNLFGALAVTQAMLGLLRAGGGRIVFVSSVSGQIAPPFIGPYAASKFALEAMCDALRMELSAFSIPVSVVQPGNVKTPIWQKGRDEKPAMLARLPAQAHQDYGAVIEAMTKLTQREERTGIDPLAVARVIGKALTDRPPRARYPVGTPAGWQRKMAALMPERWRDKLILKNFRAQ